MRKPNFYKQYDSRWANKSWKGQTLKAHGCGPTAIANVISACPRLNHAKVTPADTWKWICDHGYMTVGHGTIWDGITKCLEHYGINDIKISTDKETVKKALKKNNFAIPLMGRGLWTKGGHFITAYYVDEKGYIYISDPASGAAARQKNTFERFWRESKRTWLIVDTTKYFNEQLPDPTPKETKKVSLTVYSDDGYANVRKGRSTKFAVVGRLTNGEKVKLKNYKNGWYQLASGTYKGYYISEKVLTKNAVINQKYEVVAKNGLRVRDGYTTKAKILKVLKRGTKVTASKRKGDWVYIPSQRGWMCVKYGNEIYLKEVK